MNDTAYSPGVLPSRILVLGLARSGRAVAAAALALGSEVVAHDVSDAVEREGLEGVEVHLGPWSDSLLEAIGLVVKSPGVPEDAEPVIAARRTGIEVVSEVEFGARLLPNPLVGVTGTNGKTTTTALLGAIFEAASMPVEIAGNIGRPLSSLVGSVDPSTWIVCELSSFQLEGVQTLHPRVALLTNLEPDHLDRHGSFDAYAAAKLRVFALQGAGDVAVVPYGFGEIPGSATRIEFSGVDLLPAEPLIPGSHNRENAAAATAAARAVGIDDAAIAEALLSFSGVAHRIEEIAVIDGVRYVNDSKATNAAAALRALASFPGAQKHVILGGRGKSEPYDALAAAFEEGDRAYLIGEAAPQLAEALSEKGVPYVMAGTLEMAVSLAAPAASETAVVLLSPACASFDQFTSFEHRGEEFRRLVQKLTK